MSHAQLLALANSAHCVSSSFETMQHATVAMEDANAAFNQDCLRTIQPASDCDFGWDELSRNEPQGSRVEDDVNGLSLVYGSSSSSAYLGVTSVPSMIRAIIECSPRAQDKTNLTSVPQMITGSSSQVKEHTASGHQLYRPACSIDEATCVNAYFAYVHPITPMVDEAEFRKAITLEKMTSRNGDSWCALRNMVLALGYIASASSTHLGHITYYKSALKCMDLSCLGSGHIHTVQALALLGGYYLHYCNKPNMASAVMGAAMRMAVGIGLHITNYGTKFSKEGPTQAKQRGIEIRIRTWWSVFCLDTWAGTTLGRPVIGSLEVSMLCVSPPTLQMSLVCYFLDCYAFEAKKQKG